MSVSVQTARLVTVLDHSLVRHCFLLLNIQFLGLLKEPIHAKNLNQTFKEIYSVCQNPFIIAIDSCLGYAQHVGCITLSPLPLLPGRGVSKQLPPIGQLSITGIVNVFSDSVSNESVIQNTRLHTVIKLADFITNGIKSANIPSIYQVSCPHP